ncbi:MAG: M14 family metallopeptidase [Candidatus Omnitrophota bacterium]
MTLLKKYQTFIILIFIIGAILGFRFASPGETVKTNTLPWVQEQTVTVPLRFDYYYTTDMIVAALEKLHRAYPDLTTLDLVGKSEEGRAIYCLIVNNPRTGKALDKPGIYVDGNIHGNEIQAAEVALYLLDYLLGNYGKNKELTELVDKKSFYVIPTLNPDGRYHFFKDGNNDSSSRGVWIPRDDDHDGLVDEDFPEDLDRDGNICMMRKRDPYGPYRTDPQDPRVMVRVKPGEKGEWTLLGDEGIDHDGDGKIGEDAEGYVDANRNMGYNWQPPYVQEGAGNFPMEAMGLKALADYIPKHPNICMVWAFHNFSGMYLRGPSTKVQGEYPLQDIAVYDYLGKQSERITPGYRYLLSWKDLYPTYGDLTEWMCMTQGCYCFVGELSVPETDERFKTYEETLAEHAKQSKDGDGGHDHGPGMMQLNADQDRERLGYSDHLTHGEMFVPWHAFKHPTLGDIEIGGWIKYAHRIPAPFMLKDLVHRNASAILFSARQTPEVSMDVFDQQRVSGNNGNLYRIRVRLENGKAMPTMSYQAQKSNLYPQDMLQVSGKDIRVIAGGKIISLFPENVSYKKYRPETQFLVVPGFGKVEYEFLVSGTGEIQINYSSRHAGKISKTVRLP